MTTSNNKTFKEGYELFSEIASMDLGAEFAKNQTQPYLDSINSEIEALTNAMNSYKGNNNPSLNGYLAEVWHKYTFNINSAAKQTREYADMPTSNKLGSVDIHTSWEDYSLKYCNTGKSSAISQAHSLEFAYRRYISKIKDGNPIPTREEYLKQNGVDLMTDTSLPLYEGQARLIPSDQMNDAIAALKDKLRQLSTPEREHLKVPYQETLDKLTDHIESPNGAQSMPLTQAQSKALQECVKQGKFAPERYNITLAKQADQLFICKKALEAGVEAAILTALLKVVPIIISTLQHAIHNGYISEDDLEKLGTNLKSGIADGFVRGIITSAITNCCLVGYCGDFLQQAAQKTNFAPVLATMIVLSIEGVKESIKCYKGEITKQELAYALEKKAFIALGAYSIGKAFQMGTAYIVGSLTQTAMPYAPVIGYIIGSMVGSLIAGVIYDVKETFFMSLCIEHNITFFGLVEQDYTLPNKIKKQLGYDVFQYEGVDYEKFDYDSMNYEAFNYEPFEYGKLDLVMLKRGVIGVRKVGYNLD